MSSKKTDNRRGPPSALRTPSASSTGTAQSTSAELTELDEELARQAEDAIKTAGAEEDFDLEGEFLSQEEITQIMAEESSAWGEEVPSALLEEQLPPELAQVEAAGAAAPPVEAAPPDVERAETAGEPSGADRVKPLPAEPTDSPDGAAAMAEAGEYVGVDELAAEPAAVGEAVSEAAEPAAAAPMVDSAADSEGEGVLASASQPAEQVVGPKVAPAWQRELVRVATLLDRPFGKVPKRIKDAIGWAGAVALLAGVAVWVIGGAW